MFPQTDTHTHSHTQRHTHTQTETHTHTDTDLDGGVFRGRDHDREDWVEDDTRDGRAMATQGVSLRGAGDPLLGIPLLGHRTPVSHLLLGLVQLRLQLHDLERRGPAVVVDREGAGGFGVGRGRIRLKERAVKGVESFLVAVLQMLQCTHTAEQGDHIQSMCKTLRGFIFAER